jgi:hypothetical protein
LRTSESLLDLRELRDDRRIEDQIDFENERAAIQFDFDS